MTAAYSSRKLTHLLFVHQLASRGVRADASDSAMTDARITRAAADGDRPLPTASPAWRMLHTPAAWCSGQLRR